MAQKQKILRLSKLYDDLARDSFDHFILFADLCGSTLYKQRLIQQKMPNNVWLHRQLIFLSMVASHFEAKNGTIVKTIGDSVMISFHYSESAEDILFACVDLTIKLDQLQAFKGKHKMAVKISIDYGDTVNGAIVGNAYDPLGICVDRCARLNAEAEARQIVFSDSFNSLLKAKKKQSKQKMIMSIHNSIEAVKTKKKNIKGVGRITFHTVKVK